MSIRMPVQVIRRFVFSVWALAAVSGLSLAAEQADLEKTIAGHLNSGEFGAALDAAQGIADPVQRDAVLQQIVGTQLQSGDILGAMASTQKIADRTTRGQQRGQVAEAAAQQGGTGADFDQLIDLILEQTQGPWESIDGIGGPDPREYENGVLVDPHGLLFKASEKEVSGRLAALGIRAWTTGGA